MTAPRVTRLLILGLAFGACSILAPPNVAWAGGVDQMPAKTSDDASSARQRRPFHEFPQAFHGRWAHVAADCRASGPSAILSSAILSIDAKGLSQAEGGFVVTSILQARDNPRQLSVNARNSGGGEDWDSLEEFTLSKDGKVIEWRQLEPEPSPVTRLYRCK